MTAIIIIVIIIIVIIVVTMAFTSQHFIYAFIQSLTWCKDTVCLLCGQLISIFVEKKAKQNFNFVRRVADNKDWVNVYLCVNEVFCPHSNADKRSCYVFSYTRVHSVLRQTLPRSFACKRKAATIKQNRVRNVNVCLWSIYLGIQNQVSYRCFIAPI